MTKKIVAPIALPFDVPGNTSAGKLTIVSGADIGIPSALAQVKLWNVHPGSDELDPDTGKPRVREVIGYAEAVRVNASGDAIEATFVALDTAEAGRCWDEVASGGRDGISVEMADLHLTGDGLVHAMQITGWALCPVGAYPGTLSQAAASATVLMWPHATDTDGDTMTDTRRLAVAYAADEPPADTPDTEVTSDSPAADMATAASVLTSANVTVEQATQTAQLAAQLAQPTAAGSVPTAEASAPRTVARQPLPTAYSGTRTPAATASAPTGGRGAGPTGAGPRTMRDVVRTIAAAAGVDRTPEVTAALSDVGFSGAPFALAPEYVGELWSGVQYERRFVPLVMSDRPLRRLKSSGWRWTAPPEVEPYSGDKSAIPSAPIGWELVPATAERLAGGHDIDRAFWDFEDEEFLSAYFERATEDYARKSDSKVESLLWTGSAPSAALGLEAPDVLRAIAVGSSHLELAEWVNTPATFALVNPLDRLSLLDVTNKTVPAFLSEMLGLTPSRFTPSALVPQGTVVVGVRQAARFEELPSSPIRVTVPNVANGGQDTGLFGYVRTLVENPRALVRVAITAPPVEPEQDPESESES